MKAMLMAAGRGERMRPLTDCTAKPLLKANGTRLIEFHLHKLAGSGITEIVINTSWQAQQVRDCLGDGSHYGVCINYSHEPQALETAGGVANALPLLGDAPFLLISADIWCDIDFQTVLSPRDDELARLVMVDNPQHHAGGDFGLDSNGTITSAAKPKYTYSGIGMYKPKLFKLAANKSMPLREVLTPAIEQRQISGQHHTGKWLDIGTPERLHELHTYLLCKTD